MPVMTCTGLVACTSEPLKSDASVGAPTSSATSPAFSVSVSVPPAAVALMPPPATTDPVVETLTLTVVLSAVAVMRRRRPLVGERPAAVPGDAVVTGHRGARQEQRRVVRERVAADGPAVLRARLVARARRPALAGGAALAVVLEGVELVDGDRHARHEVVGRAAREHARGERRHGAAEVVVGVRALQRHDPRQVDLRQLLGRDRRGHAGRRVAGARHRDVRGLGAGVRDDHGEVEDRPDVVRRHRRPVVAPDVRVRRRGARARRRIAGGTRVARAAVADEATGRAAAAAAAPAARAAPAAGAAAPAVGVEARRLVAAPARSDDDCETKAQRKKCEYPSHGRSLARGSRGRPVPIAAQEL